MAGVAMGAGRSSKGVAMRGGGRHERGINAMGGPLLARRKILMRARRNAQVRDSAWIWNLGFSIATPFASLRLRQVAMIT